MDFDAPATFLTSTGEFRKLSAMATSRMIAAAGVLGIVALSARAGRAQPKVEQKPRGAITSITLMANGPVKPSLKAVYRAVTSGLTRAGLDVLSAAQVERGLGAHERLLGCQLKSCLERIGALLNVPMCVHAKLWSDPKKVRIDVIVTDTRDGRRLAHLGKECPGCSTQKAVTALGRLATEAGRRAVRAWRVRIVAKRHPRVRRRLDRSKTFWVTGLALISAGVAATVAGATLWALDGRDKPDRDPLTEPRVVLDSKPAGIATTAVGVASALTGVGLLVYGLVLKRRARPVVGIVIDPSRGRALVTGRFEF